MKKVVWRFLHSIAQPAIGMSIREELENPTMPLAMGINTAEISVLEVKFKITSCPLRSKGVGVVGLFYHANS